MGQKVNPHGARVGVIFNWSASWYGDCVSLVVSSCYGGTDAPFYQGWCFDFESGNQLTATHSVWLAGLNQQSRPHTLEEAKQRLQAQEQQAQQEARDRDREDASTEEQYLMDLEDHLKKITSDAATSSAKKNALKFIKTAFEEQYEYFDDKQKQRFWETGEAINAILNDKTTSKFLKKRTELAPN